MKADIAFVVMGWCLVDGVGGGYARFGFDNSCSIALSTGLCRSESRHTGAPCKASLPPHIQGSYLPEFPRTRDLKLPYCVPGDRLNTFLAMYRVHCQHIFEAITR